MLVAVLLRDQVKAIHQLRQQLEAFDIHKSKCHCCSVNHVNPENGERIACDRELIEESVICWFGSIEAFASYVPNYVLKHMNLRAALPYHYMLFAGMPYVYEGIGACGGLLLRGRWDLAVPGMLGRLADWLIFHPAVYALTFTVLVLTLPRSSSGCLASVCRLILSSLAVCAALGPYITLWGISYSDGTWPWGVCTFYALSGAGVVFYFRRRAVLPALARRS